MMNGRHLPRTSGDSDEHGQKYVTPEPLKLVIDPGTAPMETITELFCALSELYISMGGEGLHFEVTDQKSGSGIVVEGHPITFGPIDQPPHSFKVT